MAKAKQQEEEEEIIREKPIVINYNDKLIKLTPLDIDDEIDADKICKIDLNNLIPEIITFPVIVNRLGNLLAKAESELAKKKLDFEIFEAKSKEEIRNNASDSPKKITVDEVNTRFTILPAYKIYSKQIIDAQMRRDVINSLFWSSRDKSGKLDKMSLTIQRDDLENVSSMIFNGIKIVVKEPLIK